MGCQKWDDPHGVRDCTYRRFVHRCVYVDDPHAEWLERWHVVDEDALSGAVIVHVLYYHRIQMLTSETHMISVMKDPYNNRTSSQPSVINGEIHHNIDVHCHDIGFLAAPPPRGDHIHNIPSPGSITYTTYTHNSRDERFSQQQHDITTIHHQWWHSAKSLMFIATILDITHTSPEIVSCSLHPITGIRYLQHMCTLLV